MIGWADLLQVTPLGDMSQIMTNSAISAYLGYLVDMTANNSLKIMLMPDEVQDTRTPEPYLGKPTIRIPP